ncbi:hypothetical protein J6590_042482 [Homalodisca vitripennis]|nr:hypothetical protein J6590_042482 [Homalodisca vitripennis]
MLDQLRYGPESLLPSLLPPAESATASRWRRGSCSVAVKLTQSPRLRHVYPATTGLCRPVTANLFPLPIRSVGLNPAAPLLRLDHAASRSAPQSIFPSKTMFLAPTISGSRGG